MGGIKIKINDNGWIIVFLTIVVSLVAMNLISPYWTYLWLTIGMIIFVFLLMYPLFFSNKNMEIDSLYSELHSLYEELDNLKKTKRRLKKGGKTGL
jgi:hypothetical protein